MDTALHQNKQTKSHEGDNWLFAGRPHNVMTWSKRVVPLQDMLGKGKTQSLESSDERQSWQARCAVLSALATYLHASPSVQRAAVRKWEPVAALFGLLWDDSTRKIALSMVRQFGLTSIRQGACGDVPLYCTCCTVNALLHSSMQCSTHSHGHSSAW